MPRITHRHVTLNALREPAARPTVEAMIDIVLATFEGPPREVVEARVIFREPEADCVLLERGGELVGFSCFLVRRFELEGRAWGVMDAGVYLRPDARGGGLRVGWTVLRGAMAFKARHPATPLCLVGEATTPVSYLLACRTMGALYPRRGVEAPAEAERLVRAVMAHRDYLPVEGDPWRVSVGMPVRLRDEARMRGFLARTDDPDVAFYLARNPGFLDGQWLVVFIPMSAWQLGWAALRWMAAALR